MKHEKISVAMLTNDMNINGISTVVMNYCKYLNKEKFNIIYKHFAKPIADMKMTYNNSAMTIEAKVVNPKVSKCFQALMDALNKQLDSYRK